MIYPNVEFITKKWVRLREDFATDFGTVPEGFECDGASVPRPFRWLLHPMGVLLPAAIFHDYCYVNAIKNKSFADKAFRDIALECGVNKYKVKIAYWAVKHFGKGNY